MRAFQNCLIFAFRRVAWCAAAALALYAQPGLPGEEAASDQSASPPAEANTQPEDPQEGHAADAEETHDSQPASLPDNSAGTRADETAAQAPSPSGNPDVDQGSRVPETKPESMRDAAPKTPKPAPASENKPDSNTRATSERTPSAAPRQAASPDSNDFAAFKIISERNIFDPNRSPRRRDNRPTARPKTAEHFALVGIMSYDKGPVAFFDGSSSQFRKALHPNDKIAGWSIETIEADAVKLASGTNAVELVVGGRMRREEEGDWGIANPAETHQANSADAAPAQPAQSPPESAEPDSDILKKMMQRREQE